MQIKKNDTVVVIAGKDKGKTGTVLRVLPKRPEPELATRKRMERKYVTPRRPVTL